MIQSLINNLYRYPISQYKTWQKFGGYWTYKRMFAHERAMAKAAQAVVVQPPPSDLPTSEVYLLTGKKFWHQTVFCAFSLQKHSPNPIFFHIYDDGSLNQINDIKKQLPNSRIVYSTEIAENLNKNLSVDKYPYLHKKREVYKHIRKLTDIYTDPNRGWKLVLDSDMLFWRTPSQMLLWIQKPSKPFYILDCETAYGYSIKTMSDLVNDTIQERINVGALGLHTDLVDFDKLEYWAKTLEEKHGTSYYLEQALSAMLIGSKECEIGSEIEYKVYPTEQEVANPTAALHHYVDVSKKWYLKKMGEIGSL